MARNRLPFRRGSSGLRRLIQKSMKWTGNGVDAELSLAAANSNTHELVVPDDYRSGGAASTGVEAGGATLQRIILDMNLRATVVGGVIFMYVAAIGDTEVPFVATALGTIISGDVLWQDHYMVPASAQPIKVHADIRVKRKLEEDRVVLITSVVAQTITYTWNARCLVRMSS